MERQEFAADYGQLRHTALPIELGGTFGRTPEEALINLGVASASSLGGNGGVAKLAASGYIDLTTVPDDLQYLPTVYGDDTVLVGSTNEYRITNYDLNTPYTVTADHGTAVVEGDVVRFTAPATPASSGFTLNNEHTTVDVVYPSPLKPTILAPVDLAQNQAFSGLLVKSSAFKMLGGSDIHEMSDWELSKVSNFATIEQSSYADGINLTTWSPADLASQTEYYVRARHKSVEHGWSPWGPAIKFKTKVDGVAGNVVVDSGPFANGDKGGFNIALSQDGSTIAFSVEGSDNYGTNVGRVCVMRKVNGSWSAPVDLPLPTGNAGGGTLFGNGDISLNYNGTVIAVGSTYFNIDKYHTDGKIWPTAGMVFVYYYNNNTYTIRKITSNATGAQGYMFGESVAISSDGKTLIASLPNTPGGPKGRLEVFTNTTNDGTSAWIFNQTIIPPTTSYAYPSTTASFGFSLSMSDDAQVFAVSKTNMAGVEKQSVFIYRKDTSGVYNIEFEFARPGSAEITINGFGSVVKMSANGDIVAIGSNNALNELPTQYLSPVYVLYKPTGSGWQVAPLLQTTAADYKTSAFGVSLTLAKNGNTIYVGAPGSKVDNVIGSGIIYKFERVGNEWKLSPGAIFSPFAVRGTGFGSRGMCSTAAGDILITACTMSSAGRLLIIG